jgi:hypothetical protein
MVATKIADVKIVMTSGINERVAMDTMFAKHVTRALGRFFVRDWGQTHKADWVYNDQDSDALDEGNFGRVLASYSTMMTVGGIDIDMQEIWIIRNIAEANGKQHITILFPEEY